MTNRSALITIEFLDWWHAGTGRSGHGDADMIAYRDRFGCPALPMTHVKGVLRDTAERFGLRGDDLVKLFGEANPGIEKPDVTGAGLAFTGDASLEPEEREWFKAHTTERGQLFGWLSATRIDEKTGAASAETLRSIEVCVPLKLTKRIDWIGRGDPPANWVCDLDRVCALTPAFGKQRNDGLGRAIAQCEPL